MNTLFTLDKVSFGNICFPPLIEIAPHKTTFICGESGRGKTSLLKMLSGLLSPQSGTVFYQGHNIEDRDPVLLRQEVLLCRQATYLFEGTIEENFENFYRYRALPAPCNAEMGDFLSTCAINFNLDVNCDLMSGGERHRIYLAICLSLAREKGVLLLDEPTGALDDATSEKVLSNIVAYCREKEISLVIVSHNEALIESFADDRIHLQSTAQKKSGS